MNNNLSKESKIVFRDMLFANLIAARDQGKEISNTEQGVKVVKECLDNTVQDFDNLLNAANDITLQVDPKDSGRINIEMPNLDPDDRVARLLKVDLSVKNK